jgi:hypothetical protein
LKIETVEEELKESEINLQKEQLKSKKIEIN